MLKHLPPINPNTQHDLYHRDPITGEVTAKSGPFTRQGAMRRQQIKAPCLQCNTGWMKETNIAAQEVIVALIERGPFPMTADQRLQFAKWATMLSMTYEFADVRTLVSTPQERLALMETGEPPADWAVLIGAFGGGKWSEIHNHRSLRRISIETGIADDLKAQTNVFTLGKTAVNTICRLTETPLGLASYAAHFGLQIVWPLWALENEDAPTLDDAALWRIATPGM